MATHDSIYGKQEKILSIFFVMESSADISRNERLATNAFQLDRAKKNTEEGGVILHARHSYAVFNIEKFVKNPDNSIPHGRDEQDGFKYQAVINVLSHLKASSS